MKASGNTLHIALAFDQNFITPFYVLVTSIFINNKTSHISFHVIAEDLTEDEKKSIVSFINLNNSDIHFYTLDKRVVRQFTLPGADHISAATFYRLYFSQLLPGTITKLLYLDTDIIVIGDLVKLYSTPLTDHVLAAVADAQIVCRPEIGIENPGDYFNAGVILINLEEWKLKKISERAIEFLSLFPEKALWADQDALNYVLANNWHRLEKGYNITFFDIPRDLRKQEFDNYLKGKTIIHYTTQNKPWLLTCANRLRYLYEYYFYKSPCASQNKFIDEKNKSQFRYKLIKRQLKEFLIDIGIPV